MLSNLMQVYDSNENSIQPIVIVPTELHQHAILIAPSKIAHSSEDFISQFFSKDSISYSVTFRLRCFVYRKKLS